MIFDSLNNGEVYSFGPAWEMALAFIRALPPEHEDGEIALQGDDIFARIMSYDTQAPEISKIETHDCYVDVQSSLRGAEGIDWWLRDTLSIKTPYDELKDATFYKAPLGTPARINVQPRYFTMLFPHDAHRPKQIVGGSPEHIKKVVVKIKKELLLGAALEA